MFEEACSSHTEWQACDNNYEGIRINADKGHGNGWFLIRLSVHDPIIVLNAESNEKGGISEMLKEIYEVISKADNIDLLDISALEALI